MCIRQSTFDKFFMFFRYYINETADPDNSNYQLLNPTLADFKVALKDVWPIITVYVCCIISINMDNISNLIVSEFHGDGTAWSGKKLVLDKNIINI